jgi:glycosyltransferase involved in cell wall biosynthesis
MTVVYFITTVGHGKGGHFHSLNTIANAIGETENVHVVNLGVKPSEVLDQTNYNLSFINFNGYNFLSVLFRIKKLIRQLEPDVIHAFDVHSFAFSRLLSKSRKQASFLNKCGGPNPKKYFPVSDNLVLFSKENKAYFEKKERYNYTKLTLIPNRVRPVKLDRSRIEAFYAKHGKADLSLLRIARIGKHYHKSISQAINLISWLKAKGCNVRLIVIGTIQSETNYNAIVEAVKSKGLEKDVIIETSDEFTYNASEMLDIGDVIIGTGRNFMEASSLNKMLLVPYKDSDYPLLVTDNNFEAIFATNFSPRTQVTDFNEQDNLDSIYKALKSKEESTSKLWFEAYFNVKKGVDLYKNVYLNQDVPKNSNLIDTFANILYAIKTFVLK